MRIYTESGRGRFRSSLLSTVLVARSLYGILVVLVFQTLHTGDCVLFSAGKEWCGLAEACTGFQSAPSEVGEKCLFRSISNFALTKLLPHFGCRVGEDGINQSGDYTNGFGRGGQHPSLQRRVIGF